MAVPGQAAPFRGDAARRPDQGVPVGESVRRVADVLLADVLRADVLLLDADPAAARPRVARPPAHSPARLIIPEE